MAATMQKGEYGQVSNQLETQQHDVALTKVLVNLDTSMPVSGSENQYHIHYHYRHKKQTVCCNVW